MNWDQYFLGVADFVRKKSKDPSSQIGAVIVDNDNQIVSTGFNGFPRGINEKIASRWERPEKYRWVSHAERNAIDAAARRGIKVQGCRLYLVGFGPPTVPCVECAKSVIQAGITMVIGFPYIPARQDWKDDLNFSLNMLIEAGVQCYDHLTAEHIERVF